MGFWKSLATALRPVTVINAETEAQLRLATGALLLEMCRADFQIHATERASIAQTVREQFGLSVAETRDLMEAAESESECAVSMNIYTSLIKDHATTQQKSRLLEDLWRVAYADNEIHQLEERLVRRVAELLEMPQKLISQAREAVRLERRQAS